MRWHAGSAARRFIADCRRQGPGRSVPAFGPHAHLWGGACGRWSRWDGKRKMDHEL